ncbi:MAG: ankyrin repeat domain-containing protein [Saprospiraceae bacterium]|nr:ankyrin repeat domain-containing protein [Saprospiraceae bacterium]
MSELMKAIKANNLEKLQELVKNNVDINQADASGDWPVIMAAYLGHVSILSYLLKQGADLSVLDPGMKATALHAAAYAGRAEAANLLIQYGINIDLQGPYNGYTALHDAVWQGHVETASIILKGGADKTIKSNQGQTPLDLAKSLNKNALIDLLSS